MSDSIIHLPHTETAGLSTPRLLTHLLMSGPNDGEPVLLLHGKLGLRDDWPGEEEFPPQPVLTQVEYALEQYQQQGDAVQRLILPDVGHTPYLERPTPFRKALLEHLQAS